MKKTKIKRSEKTKKSSLKINYQILNFNYNKAIDTIQNNHENLDSVIIGDFSCFNRNIFFTKNNLKLNILKKITEKYNVKLLYQLPFITKEDELKNTKKFIEDNFDFFDGFITGDLGVVSIIDKIKSKKIKKLIYTTNIINKEFASYLNEKFNIYQIRPLFFKRTFIEEDVNFDKDIIIYGNMMLNCATFCFHGKDLVENCKFNCQKAKRLIMRKELLYLIGRSLITENRLDLIDRIPNIENLKSVTILDYNLKKKEIENIIDKIKKKQK